MQYGDVCGAERLAREWAKGESQQIQQSVDGPFARPCLNIWQPGYVRATWTICLTSSIRCSRCRPGPSIVALHWVVVIRCMFDSGRAAIVHMCALFMI